MTPPSFEWTATYRQRLAWRRTATFIYFLYKRRLPCRSPYLLPSISWTRRPSACEEKILAVSRRNLICQDNISFVFFTIFSLYISFTTALNIVKQHLGNELCQDYQILIIILVVLKIMLYVILEIANCFCRCWCCWCCCNITNIKKISAKIKEKATSDNNDDEQEEEKKETHDKMRITRRIMRTKTKTEQGRDKQIESAPRKQEDIDKTVGEGEEQSGSCWCHVKQIPARKLTSVEKRSHKSNGRHNGERRRKKNGLTKTTADTMERAEGELNSSSCPLWISKDHQGSLPNLT